MYIYNYFIYLFLFILFYFFDKDDFRKHKNVIVHSPKSVTGPDLTEKEQHAMCTTR